MERLENSKFKSFISFWNTFFIFVPQNKTCMIKVKKQNVLYD